jgi:nucleoid DNA-binding protein
MGRFGDIPVYTKSSVITTKDEHKQQEVIDAWTDELAVKMAEKTDCDLLDDGTVVWHKRDRRGGYNRQTIEVLNTEGYLVKVFHSIAELAKYMGVKTQVVSNAVNGIRKSVLIPGYILRRRETASERRQREKSITKANKTREKTIKKKRNYGKIKKAKD